jgi:AcrR family transcriptional regulator
VLEAAPLEPAPAPHLSPILTAALDLFSARGFHGTTVRDIAERVGVTVPALYYHHENKEAILEAVLNASMDQLQARCDESLRGAASTPDVRFLNLVECLVDFMITHRGLAAVGAEIRALPPAKREVYVSKRKNVETTLLRTIEEGLAARLFDVPWPADAAKLVLSTVQGVPVWYRLDGPVSREVMAARVMEFVAQSVGASPTVIARVRHVHQQRLAGRSASY